MEVKFDVGRVVHQEILELEAEKETAESLYTKLLPVTEECFSRVVGEWMGRVGVKGGDSSVPDLPVGSEQGTEGASYHRRKLPFDVSNS